MQVLKQLQIPYSFAKRHGVLLRYEGDQVFIIRRENTAQIAIQEARRYLGRPAHHHACLLREAADDGRVEGAHQRSRDERQLPD